MLEIPFLNPTLFSKMLFSRQAWNVVSTYIYLLLCQFRVPKVIEYRKQKTIIRFKDYRS